MMKRIIMLGMSLIVCFYCLHKLDVREQKVVYSQCLLEYNYSDLAERLKKVNSKSSKQRLEARQLEVQAICSNKAQEHFSI